jgi:rhamnulokinase
MDLVGVASHDTASAFAGTPVADRDRALILSLGTWALIGAEVDHAEPGELARAANITHELGIDETVRVLGNVCGMWLFEECRRDWARQDGKDPSVSDLVDAALREPPRQAIFDVDTPALAAPGQSERTIAALLVGGHAGTRGAVVRSLLESLVVRLADREREIERVLGVPRPVLHVVGGASRIAPLMQWLADASGRTVVAGPVEATAIGNALVQWRTTGAVRDLAAARSIIGRMPQIRTFEPRGDQDAWIAFGARLEQRDAQ